MSCGAVVSDVDWPPPLEGTPWDNQAIYDRLSPIRHVKNVTAKMLIMHGANDARVPPTLHRCGRHDVHN